MVIVRSPDGDVDERNAEPSDALRKELLAAIVETISDPDRRKTGRGCKRHARTHADPLVFDGVLEEERRAEHQRDDADPVDQRQAETRLERGPVLRGSRGGGNWNSRRLVLGAVCVGIA